MPDSALSGLYPQPPAQPQSLLSNPQSLVSTLGDVTRLRILNQQADALGQIPQQQLIGQQIQNQTAQIQQQDAMRKAYTGAVVNSLAGIKNPKPDDVYNAITNASRFYPAAAVMGVPNALSDNLTSGGDISGNVRRAQASILSPEAAATPVTAPPGPGGVPRTQTLAERVAGGTQPVGQPVGEEEGQKAAATAAANFESEGPQSAQYHANLENMKDDSKILGNLAGPSLEVESRLNALSQRIGNVGVTMTPEQLKAKDSFGKIVNQLSLGQGSLFANAGNTDAARSMQLHANPNVEMTQASREGLIDMLQGNQDARDVLRNVWNSARNPKDGSAPVPRNAFNDEIRDFTMSPLNKEGAKFDPRVFQFNRMAPSSRQAFINQMSPADALQFSKNAHEAVARGWIPPLTKPNANQQQ